MICLCFSGWGEWNQLEKSKKLSFLYLYLSHDFAFRERHFGSVVGASGTLIALGGRDGSATPMALGIPQYFLQCI